MFQDAVTEAEERSGSSTPRPPPHKRLAPADRDRLIAALPDWKLKGRSSRSKLGSQAQLREAPIPLGPHSSMLPTKHQSTHSTDHVQHTSSSAKLVQAARPHHPITWSTETGEVRPWLGGADGHLERGDGECSSESGRGPRGPTSIIGIACVRGPLEGQAAIRGSGSPRIAHRLAGTPGRRQRPRPARLSGPAGWQRHHQPLSDVHGDLEQPRHQGLGGPGPVLDAHGLAHAGQQLGRHHQQRDDDVSALPGSHAEHRRSHHQPDQANYYTQGFPEPDPARARRPVHPAHHSGRRARDSRRSREGRAARRARRHPAGFRRSPPSRSSSSPSPARIRSPWPIRAPEQHRRPVLHHQRRPVNHGPAGLRLQLHDLRPARRRPADGERPGQGGRDDGLVRREFPADHAGRDQ